ncbi:hypothetical protein pb186bvf_013529 [Paramecium bursaria]
MNNIQYIIQVIKILLILFCPSPSEYQINSNKNEAKQKIMNILEKIDQFGTNYQQSIGIGKKSYKSIFGGIITLIVYSLCLLYFVYKFYLWTSGQLDPKISTVQQIIGNSNVTFDFNPIMVDLPALNGLDPLDPTNLIMMPYYVVTYDNQPLEFKSLLFNTYPNSLTSRSKLVIPQNVSLQYQNNVSSQAVIAFQVCDRTLYQYCAAQELIDLYFKQPQLFVNVYLTIKTFNQDLKKFELITNKLQYAFEIQFTLYNRVLFQIQNTDVSEEFLIQNYVRGTTVNSFYNTLQTLSLNFFTSIGQNVIAVIQAEINGIGQKQTIQYPILAEILADVGSIMSTLLTIKILVILFNNYMMEQQIIDSIIKFYFPEYRKLNLQRNYFNKVISVNDGQISLQSYNKFYQQAYQIAQKKLTVQNQIYEISRIQFILQSLQNRQLINQSHQIGIKIIWPIGSTQISAEESSNEVDDAQLQMDDYSLMVEYNDNIELRNNPFYEKNKI